MHIRKSDQIRKAIQEAIKNFEAFKKVRPLMSFRLFRQLDKGLKRSSFLLESIGKAPANEIFSKFCEIYADKREIPYGLGNSNKLREYLCLSLCDAFEIKASEDEIKQATNELSYEGEVDGSRYSYTATREEAIKYVMAKKADELILKRANDKKNRIAFLSGFHELLGAESPLRNCKSNPIFDDNLVETIFCFADINYKPFKAA